MENQCKFKVGDRVKVVDRGRGYTTYEEMAEHLGLENYTHGAGLTNGYIATITHIHQHLAYHKDIVCAIRTDEGQDFLIHQNGLEKIDDKIQTKKPKTGKKMYKMVSPDGIEHTPFSTFIGACMNHTYITDALGLPLGSNKPNIAQQAYKKLISDGWRVEEFYIEKPEKSDFDWEPIIIKCMDQDDWGGGNKCALCTAYRVHFRDKHIDCRVVCPLGKYAEIFDCNGCVSLSKLMRDKSGLDVSQWDKKIMIPLLNDCLQWYRKNKEQEKRLPEIILGDIKFDNKFLKETFSVTKDKRQGFLAELL